MIGHPGTAIPKSLLGSPRGAFDAVYTPVETEFLSDVRACGLEIMSGYELSCIRVLLRSTCSPGSL
jgi:shikimate dehydrogenase